VRNNPIKIIIRVSFLFTFYDRSQQYFIIANLFFLKLKKLRIYQLSSLNNNELIQRFDKPDVFQALILMGIYARNKAGPNSDVDLVRFVIAGTHLHKKTTLITICTVEPDDYDK
jgi:hypothetical protein